MEHASASWNPLFPTSALMTNIFEAQQAAFPHFNNPIDFLDVDIAAVPSSPSQSPLMSFYGHFDNTERSPSIGTAMTPSDASSRPSSELRCFMAQNSNDYRATSAVGIIAEERTSSNVTPSPQRLSIEEEEEGSSDKNEADPPTSATVNVGELDWAHWKKWDIATAPGCPPLDDLFENKRKWRALFNAAIPPQGQRHCVFCRSMKKEDFRSHNVRDARGQLTCPVLAVYTCPNCNKKGHTIAYCEQPKNQEKIAKKREESRKRQRRYDEKPPKFGKSREESRKPSSVRCDQRPARRYEHCSRFLPML